MTGAEESPKKSHVFSRRHIRLTTISDHPIVIIVDLLESSSCSRFNEEEENGETEGDGRREGERTTS
jgi:hypothetical protein